MDRILAGNVSGFGAARLGPEAALVLIRKAAVRALQLGVSPDDCCQAVAVAVEAFEDGAG